MNNKTQERVYIESLLFSDRTYSFPEIYTLVENKFPNKSISETKEISLAILDDRETIKNKLLWLNGAQNFYLIFTSLILHYQ